MNELIKEDELLTQDHFDELFNAYKNAKCSAFCIRTDEEDAWAAKTTFSKQNLTMESVSLMINHFGALDEGDALSVYASNFLGEKLLFISPELAHETASQFLNTFEKKLTFKFFSLTGIVPTIPDQRHVAEPIRFINASDSSLVR